MVVVCIGFTRGMVAIGVELGGGRGGGGYVLIPITFYHSESPKLKHAHTNIHYTHT